MKGQDRFLTEFFDGSKNRFIIPVYQRNYDWKKYNCVQLSATWLKQLSTTKQPTSLAVWFCNCFYIAPWVALLKYSEGLCSFNL